MKEGARVRLRDLAVVEAIVLMISLVLPVSPSKTGSDQRIGDLVFEDPGYLEHVLVSFVLIHGILLVVAVALWVTTVIGERREERK